MMRSPLLAGILAFLCIGAVAAAQGVDGPTIAEFHALEQRVAALEEEVFSAPEPQPSPSHSPHPSPEPSPEAPSPEPPSEFDRVLSGQIAGATVPAGETWKIEGLVESTANVVVQGTLVMRPGATLRFVGVNEAAFVGGGMDPVASDVGLWVMGAGKLDAIGTAKLAWARTTAGLSQGATSLTLDADPTGWKVGDEILVTATLPPNMADLSDKTFMNTSEVRVITGISGRTITFAALTYAHPSAQVSPSVLMTPEVANLTRDVKIEGTASGRAHIFIRNTATMPQTIKYVGLRHLGPTVVNNLGRYALHFHHSHHNNRGSLVEGSVARDIGTWGFVAHISHGITFRDNVAFNIFQVAYGWDLDFTQGSGSPDKTEFTTFDTFYDRNLAVNMLGSLSRNEAFRIQLGVDPDDGSLNQAIGNVAVGVGMNGGAEASGFSWDVANNASWVFRDNVTHNSNNGLFFWVNNEDIPAPIEGFIGYHNKNFGIELGAYGTNYEFDDNILYGNGRAQVLHHSTARNIIEWRNARLESTHAAQGGFVTARHRVWHGPPLIIDSYIKTLGSTPCIRLAASGDRELLDVVDTVFDCTNEFFLNADIDETSLVRVQITNNTNNHFLNGSISVRHWSVAGGTPIWGGTRFDIPSWYRRGR
jgi:hypothetical protein